VQPHLRPAPRTIYRVDPRIDPFEPPPAPAPLEWLDHPVRGGGRFDDPDGLFSTVYASASAESAFTESIAHYREKPGLMERILQETEPPDPDFDFPVTSGEVPASYLSSRRLGQAELGPGTLMIQIDHPDTYEFLTEQLGEELDKDGYERYDRSTILSQDRRLTRPVGRLLYDFSQAPEYQEVAGLVYPSRFYLDRRYELLALIHRCLVGSRPGGGFK
jgi:hypothetical protein